MSLPVPRCLAALLLCSVGTLSCAHPSGTPPWHQVTGASFLLRSCGDERDTLALAAGLREMRATLSSLVPAVPRADDIPFEIVVLCRGSDYTKLAPIHAQGNHFVATLRSNRIDADYERERVAVVTRSRGTTMAVRGAQLRAASDLIRHHYVHHLLRTHTELPLWIEEGLAGFVGTTSRESQGVRRGRASEGMRDLEGLEVQVPLGRVFRATDLATWPVDDKVWFYRSSWLVVHHLHYGQVARDGPPGPKLARFAELRAAGADEFQAAEAAFGRGTIPLRNAIDRYLALRRVKIRKGHLEEPADATRGAGLAIAPLSDADAAHVLGRLALAGKAAGAARERFERTLALEPQHALARAGLARALALQQQWESALAALASADSIAPRDPVVKLDGAWVYVRRGRTVAAAADDLARARQRAGWVLGAGLETAEGHYLVALASEAAGERLAALERAHAAFPAAADVGFDLARARSEAGRIEQARAVGLRVSGQVLGELRDAEVRSFLGELPAAQALAAPGVP